MIFLFKNYNKILLILILSFLSIIEIGANPLYQPITDIDISKVNFKIELLFQAIISKDYDEFANLLSNHGVWDFPSGKMSKEEFVKIIKKAKARNSIFYPRNKGDYPGCIKYGKQRLTLYDFYKVFNTNYENIIDIGVTSILVTLKPAIKIKKYEECEFSTFKIKFYKHDDDLYIVSINII